VTNRELKQYYRKFNRKYFDNSLPDIFVGYAPVSTGHAAEFISYEDGTYKIHVHPLLKRLKLDNYSLLLLVHEMAHCNLRDAPARVRHGHGPIFQKEMKRLANLGALKDLW